MLLLALMRRLKVGVFSFTCCEGCVISVIESLNTRLEGWRDRVEFVNFKALKKVKRIGAMDVAFVEGAVSTDEEKLKLVEIRENARIVVALGSGAINGWPSNLRNGFEGEKRERVMRLVGELEQIESVVPIKKVIEVDDEIAGCPVDEDDFSKMMDNLIEAKGLSLEGKKKVKRVRKKKVKKKKKVVKKNG